MTELVWYKLTEADKHLHEIEKCCGCCVCPWNRVRSTTKVKARKKTNAGGEELPPITDQPRHSGNNEGRTAGGGYIQRVTNDDREDEIEENLE